MIDPNSYSYSRNERGYLIRNEDRAMIPEDDPSNVAYALYQQWVAAGNAPIPGSPPPNAPPPPLPITPELPIAPGSRVR